MTTNSIRRDLHELLPVWLACVSVPVVILLVWDGFHGRSIALACFLAGGAALVAFSFQRGLEGARDPVASWGRRMRVLLAMLLCGALVFSLVCLIFNNPPEDAERAGWWRWPVFGTTRDLIAPMLAFMSLVPALCLAPYLTVITRSRLAAVVFSLFLVFAMKLLGAIVVVSVYGWDASEKGHTTMPWNRPNLLVWLFWGFTLALCVAFYFLGARRFRRDHGSAAKGSHGIPQRASPSPGQA